MINTPQLVEHCEGWYALHHLEHINQFFQLVTSDVLNQSPIYPLLCEVCSIYQIDQYYTYPPPVMIITNYTCVRRVLIVIHISYKLLTYDVLLCVYLCVSLILYMLLINNSNFIPLITSSSTFSDQRIFSKSNTYLRD